MIVFLNGKFVPEELARVSVLDRGFLYGDGIFETVRVTKGKAFRWRQHLERLWLGADFLGLGVPFSFQELTDFATELLQQNQMAESVLRIVLSRGTGRRGYSIREAEHPTVVISLHPVTTMADTGPKSWRAAVSSVRLRADDPCSRFKTCNKLPQILARREAEVAGADEALLLNQQGWVVEGSSSNVFWIQHGAINTPPLSSGALAGVTRAVVFELCARVGLVCREANATPPQLLEAEGVFFSLSTLGVIPGSHLDNKPLNQSPIIEQIGAAYAQLQQSETAT